MRKAGNVFDIAAAVLSYDDDATSKDIPRNVAARLRVWQFYVGEIASSGNEWAVGHPSPPDRKLYPSAHNYYLDFIYNFGFFALVPLLWLIAFTLWMSGRHWKEILAKPEFFALMGAVLFLLLVDNSLKVGLRQPYPGIVTFFLWGMLISRLGQLGGTGRTLRAEG
jgi:O-antigen ligase